MSPNVLREYSLACSCACLSAYVKRVISHPQFHNIDYRTCVELMRDLDQGDVIIRPSSKGTDHLTCTWKVFGDILQHIDVLEEKKENAFSLGHRLRIAAEVSCRRSPTTLNLS